VSQRCPRCRTTEPPEWTERSPDGRSRCSQCKVITLNYDWTVTGNVVGVIESPTADSRDGRPYAVAWQYDTPNSPLLLEEVQEVDQALERERFLIRNARDKGLKFSLKPTIYAKVT
jgi:hypothetical protein